MMVPSGSRELEWINSEAYIDAVIAATRVPCERCGIPIAFGAKAQAKHDALVCLDPHA